MLTVEQAGRVFVTPEAYADEDHFHEACALLRRESPVHRVDASPDYLPFWALTRHADVLEVELNNSIFLNEPRPLLGPAEADRRRAEQGDMLRTLIHVDGTEHRDLRGVTAEWFLPKSLGRLEAKLKHLARRYVDKMAGMGGECDFARDIAMQFPLYVILDILGLPESDYGRMLTLTQQLFGNDDEELRRGSDPSDLLAVIQDFFVYFSQLTDARRAEATDDLASAIANAKIRGEDLDVLQTISYYVIVATAGHDTTASAMAGGLQALAENPEQLERLRRDPSLGATAADEIIRWVTPVKQFMRTATEDYRLGDTVIAAGDSVLLSYPSANRDEEVFDRPFEFDVGRSPNKHLAFGFGVHYCLGAMLARMEIKALLGELVPRLASVELAGEPSLMKTLFVGGLKHLPIRYEVTAARD